MDPDPQPLTSFNLFGRLPRELQIIVWKFCLPSRVVEIAYWAFKRGLLSRNRPHISRVCQLSRYVALLHGSRVPIGLPGSHIWFNLKTDALSIDHYGEELGNGSGDRLFPNNWVNDNPVLYKHAADPEIPLCIGSQYMGNLFRNRYLNTHEGGNINIAEWVLDTIFQRKNCTVIIHRANIHLDYRTACDYGFWGHFGEQNPVHVDVNASQMQKMRAAFDNRSVHVKNLSNCKNEMLNPEQINQSISSILNFIRMTQLKQDNLYPHSLALPPQIPPMNEMPSLWAKSLQRLPRFTFVIAVWLNLI